MTSSEGILRREVLRILSIRCLVVLPWVGLSRWTPSRTLWVLCPYQSCYVDHGQSCIEDYQRILSPKYAYDHPQAVCQAEQVHIIWIQIESRQCGRQYQYRGSKPCQWLIGFLHLCSRPHTGLFCQLLISVRRHLPQVSDLQYHPQRYLSQLVLVIKYELHQPVFLFLAHCILLQHTCTTYLSDTKHPVSHTINGQIQVMASALQRL